MITLIFLDFGAPPAEPDTLALPDSRFALGGPNAAEREEMNEGLLCRRRAETGVGVTEFTKIGFEEVPRPDAGAEIAWGPSPEGADGPT